MSDDWESHRVTTAGGQFRALVYRRSSGNLSVRFPLGDYAARVEAADPQILKDIRKGASVEDNTAFVRLCVKYGIRPKVFTQVGLPGETHETIEALRRWLIDMASEGLADADVSITTPYEGTPIFDNPEEHKIHFDPSELDYSKDAILYKGVPGEYKAHVWHDGLSPSDLVAARQSIENDFRKAAGLEPLLAKDDG